MTSEDDLSQWKTVVETLKQETDSGAIKWRADPTMKRRDQESPIYCARFEDRTIVLYRFGYHDYLPDLDTTVWSNDVVVELMKTAVDSEAWRLPSVPERYDLLDSVERQVVGADEFATRLLARRAK